MTQVQQNRFAVSTVCNALMDIVVQITEDDLKKLELTRGVMTLMDSDAQKRIIDHFADHEHTVELGGSAMNAIRALAMLDAPTSFTGMIGNDGFGARIRDRMADLGIVEVLGVSDEPTGTCAVLVTPDGERTMATSLGASRLYDESHIPEDHIMESRVLHFCGYQWDTDGQKRAIRKAIDIAKKNGVTISFDAADPFVVKHHRQDFVDLIENDADIVFANEEEAKLLYDSTPEDAAARIAKSGAIAVVKLGAKGAIVRKGDEIHPIQPVETTVVDTTAAGDMFAGGFLYGHTHGSSLDEAGRIAATLASDVISRYGARLSKEAIAKVRRG